MKKIIAIFLALTMLLAFAACGSETTSGSEKRDDAVKITDTPEKA